MEDIKIFVHVDKTVVGITGLKIKGLNIQQLESLLQEKLQTMVRIIGVTGESIEMDIYGLEEDSILRKEDGIIKAISIADGINTEDLAHISTIKKIKSVDFSEIPLYNNSCVTERWL